MTENKISTIYSVIIDSIDFADIGLLNSDLNGKLNYINKGAVTLLNAPSSAEKNESNMPQVSELSYDLDILRQRAVKEKKVRGAELIVTSGSGKKYILADIYLHSIPDEAEPSLLYILRDISFYKNLEYELLRTRNSLYSLIDSVEDIIYRLDPDGRITFVSDSITHYGYKPEELIGTSILDIVYPPDREKAVFRLNERRTGERKTRYFEVRLLTKNQESVNFEIESADVDSSQFFLITSEGLYITRENDEKVFVGTQGIARDISRRKNVENRIQTNEEKWREIIDSLEEGFYEVDLQGSFTVVNSYLARMVGLDIAQMTGRKYSDLFTVDENKKIFEAFNNLYRTGIPARMVDLSLTRKDGKKRYVEGSIILIRDAEGQPSGFRGIMRDVTERMKMEQELSRARKLEAIGILAGGIAHDFNNALTAIMGNLSLAKLEIDPANAGLMEIINDAEAASFKIMELTKKLSTFARGGRPVKKLMSISDVIYETADSHRVFHKGKIEVEIEEPLKPVSVDEMQISHVIQGILQNATEAMDGGGIIEITAKNVVVEKAESHHEITLQPGEYVVVTIKDRGPGIPSDAIDRLFDPYYSTKDTGGGMGLATGFAIMKRHHGFIDVKSNPGEGAKFYLYLPVEE
jgi:PAS domain S-box-containing protein